MVTNYWQKVTAASNAYINLVLFLLGGPAPGGAVALSALLHLAAATPVMAEK